MHNAELAIIIPAYKITYLDKALYSLACQTNKNFNVYVGDDCSPDNVYAICEKYVKSLNLTYYRFDKNLGGTSLVKQWQRCVEMMNEESWIWLFSDDDIADESCVAHFYKALNETNSYYDVYRFNTCIIDSNGKVISAAEKSPKLEDARSLALNILYGKRGNSMPDHIFKRSKYVELGGFVDFIFAQSSDWATSINYALDKGLYTINGPLVSWRFSGENISSIADKNRKLMINGYLQFLRWITTRFNDTHYEFYKYNNQELINAAIYNFKVLMLTHYKGMPYRSIPTIAKQIAIIFQLSYLDAFWMCLSINFKVDRRYLKSKIFNKK